MSTINSFPIQTKRIPDLDSMTALDVSDDDLSLIYDISQDRWKKIPVGQSDFRRNIYFATRSDIDLSLVKVGGIVETMGCDAAGDGGHATFDIKSSTSLAVDGYGVIFNSGKYAIIRPTDGRYNALQFGAKNAGNIGSRDAIQRAIDFVMSLSAYRHLYCPAGTYRIEASSVTTFPSGGRVAFVVDQENNWVIDGDGQYETTWSFDALDGNTARMIDITRCRNFRFSGIGTVGVNEPFITPPATTPSPTGNFMDRGVNGADLTNGVFYDLFVDNAVLYGMGFQRGPITYCKFQKIDIGWTGNDGIDIKQNNISGVFTRDINHSNFFENITGYDFGSLTYEAPNVLLDMRTSNSVANNIVGYNIKNESYLIRTIGGNGCTINNPVAYGTSDLVGDNQRGILVGGAGNVINNPRLYNLYQHIETAFDSSDTIQPSCTVNNPKIDTGFVGLDLTVGDPSTVNGGTISNIDYRGVRSLNKTMVDAITFDACAEAVRFEAGAVGCIVQNCNKKSGGGIVHGPGTTTTNTILNCGDMATVFQVKTMGRSINIDGLQVLTNQGAAVPNAAGGTEITTINAILARLRAHGIIAT